MTAISRSGRPAPAGPAAVSLAFAWRSLLKIKHVPEQLVDVTGTFRTDTPMFGGLLVGVVLIVGALTFFPAVSLGPIVEQLSHRRFF